LDNPRRRLAIETEARLLRTAHRNNTPTMKDTAMKPVIATLPRALRAVAPSVENALSLTGATIIRMPAMVRQARARQRAVRTLSSLDRRTLEDVGYGPAHITKSLRG